MAVVSSRSSRSAPLTRVVPPSYNSKQVHVGWSVPRAGSGEIVCRQG